jgi:hypothetical protein
MADLKSALQWRLENKSASSSALTLDRALQPIEIKKNFYSVDATPSDCVHLALSGLLDEAFDLVVTGINFGPNLGDALFQNACLPNWQVKLLTMADLKSALQWRLQLYQNKPHHRLNLVQS